MDDSGADELFLHGLGLRLGSPLKVPHVAWPNWGVTWQTEAEFRVLVEHSEAAYREEWDNVCPEGYQDIARAGEAAHLGDANLRLNRGIARVASWFVRSWADRPVHILDLGAGAGGTSLALLEVLTPLERRQIQLTLLDPAGFALNAARERLTSHALVDPHALDTVAATDLDFLGRVGAGLFDLVISGAAIHHHACVLPVFERLFRAIRPGGCLVIGDWHNSMWFYPRRVLSLLTRLKWPAREADIAAFERAYPLAHSEESGALDPLEKRANDQIAEFWKAYVGQRQSKAEFLLLEGHRPVRWYLEGLAEAGFEVPRRHPACGHRQNPALLLPSSGLLAVTLALSPKGQ